MVAARPAGPHDAPRAGVAQRQMRRPALLLMLCCLALTGCGSAEADRLAAQVRQRAERVQQRAQEASDRAEQLARQVRAALKRLRRTVPSATRDDQAPAAQGTQAQTIDAFLTDVLRSVDDYWTRTLRASDLREPRVGYLWLAPGRVVQTGCGTPAGSDAAFYCPADDTIYVSLTMASKILTGAAQDFPGERAGYGHAGGDFGLAYVVAHEYAHNVQQELGLAELDPRAGVEPLELQADCMAGLWGNSVYRAGKLAPGDVDEAIGTVLAVGDFDMGNPQHHGTPEQRRDAWLLGYRTGEPARCGAAAGV
jgi:predicted metalloprotease